MEIIGITSTEMTFSVALAYLEAEREDNFSWCLNRLRSLMHGWHMPSVIITDRDLAYMNAIEKACLLLSVLSLDSSRRNSARF